MRLAWSDRMCPSKLYIWKKPHDLFKPTPIEYAIQFFSEIKDLGNINIYVLHNGKARLIFKKGL